MLGALSIGVGGIVGGGFFATFGLTIEGAKGGTPLAFLIGGVIALATAYSYIGLTLRYPGPGGTVRYLRTAFGTGIVPATLSVLLVLSYVAIMAVYATALAAYSVSHLPPMIQPMAHQIIASVAVILFGVINFFGAGLMEKLETFFNVGKLGVLGLFIIAGLLVGHLEWTRLEPVAWAPTSTIVASGMLGFLAYEGFELISNASANIANPKRTIPIALLGSVLIAIMIYVLAVVVAIGHMTFEQAEGARDFAVSAAASTFLGPLGFAIMSIGAVLASASAINADFFGAGKLPPLLAAYEELPSAFERQLRGQSIASFAVIGLLAIVAVNFIGIHALSSATSGGFLLVYATVNLAAICLRHETGTSPLLPALALAFCLIAFVVMMAQFLSSQATIASAIAIAAIVLVSLLIELAFRVGERVHAER